MAGELRFDRRRGRPGSRARSRAAWRAACPPAAGRSTARAVTSGSARHSRSTRLADHARWRRTGRPSISSSSSRRPGARRRSARAASATSASTAGGASGSMLSPGRGVTSFAPAPPPAASTRSMGSVQPCGASVNRPQCIGSMTRPPHHAGARPPPARGRCASRARRGGTARPRSSSRRTARAARRCRASPGTGRCRPRSRRGARAPTQRVARPQRRVLVEQHVRPEAWRAGVQTISSSRTCVRSHQSSSTMRASGTPQYARCAPTPSGTTNVVVPVLHRGDASGGRGGRSGRAR